MVNQKSKTGLSLGYIIPLIWMLRIASRGVTYWLSPDMGMDVEIDYLKGSPIDRTFFIILETIGFAILLYRKIDWWEFAKRNKWILLIYAFMGLSVLWSNFPMVSFKRWVRTIGDLIMVLVLISEINYSLVLTRVLRIWGYLLVPLSVLFVKYWRDLGVSYDHSGTLEMWIGVTTHKNSLGQLVCVSAIFFAWVFLSKHYKKLFFFDIPVFLMALWLLNGSKTATSRTSFGVFLYATGVLLLLKVIKTHVNVVRALGLFVFVGFFVGTVLTQHFASSNLIPWLINQTGGDPTLTGRTFLWDELMRIGSHRMIFGSGYGGFWIGNIGNQLWETFTWRPGQAHNGYIDVYIDLGLIGVILLIGFIISSFRNIVKDLSFDSEYGKFRMMMLVTVLIYNVTESSFFKPTSLLWFMLLLISIQTPERYAEEAFIETAADRKRSNRASGVKEKMLVSPVVTGDQLVVK